MDLLNPHVGTIIWMTICFLAVLFILRKFAWAPILNALKRREDSIEEALLSAEKARNEMEKLHSDNEKILAKAKVERDRLIKEARELKDEIIEEAKKKAVEESDKIIVQARESIKSEKAAALKEIKEQIADFSVTIAEKIIQEKLEVTSERKEIIDKYLHNIKVN
jgi:F-type H+-transporting ATPase subunit b